MQATSEQKDVWLSLTTAVFTSKTTLDWSDFNLWPFMIEILDLAEAEFRIHHLRRWKHVVLSNVNKTFHTAVWKLFTSVFPPFLAIFRLLGAEIGYAGCILKEDVKFCWWNEGNAVRWWVINASAKIIYAELPYFWIGSSHVTPRPALIGTFGSRGFDCGRYYLVNPVDMV